MAAENTLAPTIRAGPSPIEQTMSIGVAIRVRSVYLSAKGKALVKRMNKTAMRVLEGIVANTTMDDLLQLQELLETSKLNATERINT